MVGDLWFGYHLINSYLPKAKIFVGRAKNIHSIIGENSAFDWKNRGTRRLWEFLSVYSDRGKKVFGKVRFFF